VKGKKREFLAEAADILGVMDRDIMHLSRGLGTGRGDPSVLNRLFRSVHTLKGLSNIFEFNEITGLCHAFEDRLDALRLGRAEFDNESLDTITAAQALLTEMVNSGKRSGFKDEATVLVEALEHYCKKKEDPCADPSIDDKLFSSLTEYENFRLRENLRAGSRVFLVCASFDAASFDRQHGALAEALGKVSEVIATLPADVTDHGGIAFEMLIATARGRDDIRSCLVDFKGAMVRELRCGAIRGVRGGGLHGALASRRPGARGVESMRRNTGTIRVDVEKIENLMRCLDEFYGLKARLRRVATAMVEKGVLMENREGLRDLRDRCDDLFERMRDCVLAVKMVRIGRLFRRFEPYIERLASECGKEIGITTYGSDTEIDMSVIEELADPIMHIIRNVIDHGIESPSERLAAKKPVAGVITMSAYQKGGKVVIEVKDDGRGIDPEKVCKRAVSRGFIGSEEAGNLGRREKLDLIFLPGLSTAGEKNSVSGRGVGLDVVRENITILNGMVEVDTAKGKGTRFILTIPVSQTMIGALICEDGGNSFAIPGACVSEIMLIRDNDSLKDGFITLDGECVRAIRPSEIFNPAGSDADCSKYAVLTSVGPARLCLMVERVSSEYNMILRPLPFEERVSGVLGLAEAPDSEAALVLDIPGVMEVLSIAGEDTGGGE